MELFETNKKESEKLTPLAERCRPKSLSSFLGHEHLVGDGGIIKIMIQKGTLRSLILWGPPGTGKTTLAHIIATESERELFILNAISSGVQDVRKVIEKGKLQVKHYNNQVVLFIDEIHRFNKSQQDCLLHAVECGDIILIGATTENPSFEINSPLLSRCKVLQLKPLSSNNIKNVIQSALKNDMILNKLVVNIENDSFETLIQLANGDARIALNILESALDNSKIAENNTHTITKQIVLNAAQKKMTTYDKKGEYHYNVISAFIKSIRGSDPHAAVYYLAVMLDGGEDIEFISRRMIILASEDVGNADPMALILATSCHTAIKNIGMPEARIILSQTVIYLASAPKSNSSLLAINKAMESVKTNGCDVPLHIRNAPTKLMKDIGYANEYKYPHDYKNHFIHETYLPESVKNEKFYIPSDIGQEKKIKEWLNNLWGGTY
ncbi:MAG: replication-associated recombination protein A [Spirochaetota bacterium]|nr:replication-associated recombination protein A [Spirochaetota bacterium]